MVVVVVVGDGGCGVGCVVVIHQGEEEDKVEVVKTEEMLNPSYQYLYQVLHLHTCTLMSSPKERFEKKKK